MGTSSLLKGKVGLVVGVANDRSYAWHITKALTEHGAVCAQAHLPGEKNKRRTQRAIEKFQADPWLHPCDAGSDDDLDALFEAYEKDFGRMDFLVHSIAYADRQWIQHGRFKDTPRKAYLEAIDISAYTLVGMAQRAEPMMKESGGSIMSMSYYGSQKVVLGYNIMGVAKAALECSTRYLANEMGGNGIRVNAISGGFLRTLASSAVGGTDGLNEMIMAKAPLRRAVEGGEVGGAAVFLASDLSTAVTGETIYVDCGAHVIGG